MADKRLKQMALTEMLKYFRVPTGVQRGVKIGKKRFRLRAGRLGTRKGKGFFGAELSREW